MINRPVSKKRGNPNWKRSERERYGRVALPKAMEVGQKVRFRDGSTYEKQSSGALKRVT